MVSFSWTTIEFVAICFAIILIILFTVGGNLVVLLAFYTDPHLLTPSNHFLLSMAIADLLVGLIAMPFYSYAQIKNYWPFGSFFCKIWLTIDDVSTMASVLSIVAITIERYWSINHSVHYRRYTTKTRIRIFSILVWLIPLLNFAPGIWLLQSADDISTNNSTRTTSPTCIGAYHSHTVYLIIAQINFFAWPLVVIIVLNALIVVNLCQRSNHFLSHDSLREQQQQQMNALQEFQERKLKEETEKIAEQEELIVSITHENCPHTSKKADLEDDRANHHGNIPSVIKEVDELMIEDEVIEVKPSPLSLSNETEAKQTSSSSSSSNCCTRFKHVFLSSPPSNSKSTETCHVSPTKLRRSLFAWRNSSIHWSRKSINTTPVEQPTGRRFRRDKRAATSLLILVLVFMICLLPYVVVVVVGNIFSLEFLIDTNGQVYSAAFWLLWLNSTVNPILYPFIQPKFRDAYRRIFVRLTRKRRLTSLIVDMQREK